MWINTKVELYWDGSQYVEKYCEGFQYDGDIALCNMQSSGQISFSNIEREHFHNNPEYSGAGATPTIQISLEDFSKSVIGTTGGSYAEWDRHPNMTAGAPYAISEFYSGVRDLGGGI